MNYRHIFHAGNFADVFKHIVLIALIKALQQKDKGCCFVDTHAGIGLYDLTSATAQRNPEYLHGIAPLLQYSGADIPGVVTDYLKLIQTAQTGAELKYYPGSPYIMQQLLRPQDQLILNELHPEDYKILKHQVYGPQIHCHHRDAYEFLPAILPPNPRRGLILIDPPYEQTDEFAKLLQVIPKAIKLFPQGVYAIWYPIVNDEYLDFLADINNLGLNVAHTQLILSPNSSADTGLRGSGLVIVNAPYKFAETIEPVTEWLNKFYT